MKPPRFIQCPKCGKGTMEMFGVTESGQYKYACSSCYHKVEKSFDEDRPKRVYLYERAVEEKPMKKKYGWWAKYGHWTHTTFWKAMDHFIRGGKIRFGRW